MIVAATINVVKNIIYRQTSRALPTVTMADKLQTVKKNADQVKQTIKELKNELNTLNAEFDNILARELLEENAKLSAAVAEARKQLVQLESGNGIKQVPLPHDNSDKTQSVVIAAKQEDTATISDKPAKKEKKPAKQPKVATATTVPPVADLPLDIGRLDLRIGRIEEVDRHPDADSLYLLKVNCGEAKPRTVCSGLVKHVALDDLKNRSVVLLCNLKPVKMRGIVSEAMVMCASSDEHGVEVLVPPPDSIPGELVQCDGYVRQPDQPVMNPKKKIFEAVAPDLHTNDSLQACYKGAVWTVPGKGHIVAKSLKNVPVK